MSTHSSEQAKKKMPWKESVPLLIGLAVVAAVVLLLVGAAFLGDTDESLRRKVVGSWQYCRTENECCQFVFTADGEMAMKYLFVDIRWLWSIKDGILDLQFKGGGDTFTSLLAGLMPLWSNNWKERYQLPLRFEGDSIMYHGKEGPFVRLGR
jgi:hypothetical protein